MTEAPSTSEIAKSSPWDVFIHLLAVIALYSIVYAALTLLFQFINLAIPDPLDNILFRDDMIRYAVAVMVVFYPTYLLTWRAIEIDLGKNPGKSKLWARTGPIYLTLFLAGLMILVDLICLIYYFLGGDLTLRFVLKVASILAVAAPVILFYRDALRRGPAAMSVRTRGLTYVASAAVCALVIAGFVLAGTPRQARWARFDTEKINNLSQIQEKIVDYWQSKGVLPGTLDQLSDSISGYRAPQDPQSRAQYGYRVTGPLSFELCADFNLKADESKRNLPPWLISQSEGTYWNWSHPSGHVCFSRTIDPSRYPRRAGPTSSTAPSAAPTVRTSQPPK
jgi:hypothetical protein